MAGPSNIQRGNIDLEMLLSVNIAAGTVGSTTAAVVTVAVAGLQVGDFLAVTPQIYLWAASQPAASSMTLDSAWCGTNGVMSVSFSSISGTTVTQTTALQYVVNVARSYNFVNGGYPIGIY